MHPILHGRYGVCPGVLARQGCHSQVPSRAAGCSLRPRPAPGSLLGVGRLPVGTQKWAPLPDAETVDLTSQVKLARCLFHQASDSLSHLGCCFYFIRFCMYLLLVSFSSSQIESIHLSFFFPLQIFFFFGGSGSKIHIT